MADNKQFYKDNSPNIKEFEFIDTMLQGLSEAFDDIMSQAIDNSKVSSIRAFTNIPIQIINVADACYTLSTLLSNKEILNITGINPNLSLQEKIEVWDNIPLKIRAQALEQAGLVLMLVNPNILKADDRYGDTFRVVDFEMYDYNTGDKLVFGLDYYYEYNKIYFLKFGAQTSKYNNKSVILKNIVIDNNAPEKLLGQSLDIYANSNFSPSEYRDVITSFASAALAGPVINKINQSFNPDNALSSIDRAYGINDDENSLKGVYVVDYKSANDIMKRFWDNKDNETETLTKFDFLVTIPSEYLHKTEKVEYIQKFMNMIKPAQAAFILCPEYAIKDTLSMRYLPHSFKVSGSMNNIVNKIIYKESANEIVYLPINEIVYMQKYRYSVADLPQTDSDYYLDSLIMKDEYMMSILRTLEDKVKRAITFIKNKANLDVFTDIVKRAESVKGLSSYQYKDTIIKKDDSAKFKSNHTYKDFLNMKALRYSFLSHGELGGIKDNIITHGESEKFIVSLPLFEKGYVLRQQHVEADLPQADLDFYVDTIIISDTFISSVSREFKDYAKRPYTYYYNAKANFQPKDTIRKYDKTDKLSSASFKDTYSYKGDRFSYKSTNIKIDKIISDDSKVSSSLNKSGVYDNITIRKESQNKKPNVNNKDTLKFVSIANQVKCDSIFNYDLEQENPLKLDVENTSTDLNAVGRELVSIKLIPKS